MRMHSPPLVTVGLLVYNGERYLERALHALLAQDYPQLELVVSDNASTDATSAIGRRAARDDSRIRYVRNRTAVGALENFNLTLARARGIYYMGAGVDDEWKPTMVSRCVGVLEADEDVVVAYPEATLIDLDGRPLDRLTDRVDTRGLGPTDRLRLIREKIRSLHVVSGVVRTDALRAIGGAQRIWAPDVPMVVGLALRGSFAQLPERLFAKRIDAAEEVLTQRWKERIMRTALGDQVEVEGRAAASMEDLLRELRDVCVQVILDAPLPRRERTMIASEMLVWFERDGVKLPFHRLRGVIPARSYLALASAYSRQLRGRSGLVAPLPLATGEGDEERQAETTAEAPAATSAGG
jgi:Glycosyl transferase family 2